MSSSTIEITMPQMGVSVAEGTVVAWRAQVGDPVHAEESVCDISTDKIDSEVPAPADGVLTEILVAPGETVPVGTVLARLGATASNGAGNGAARAVTVAAAEDPPGSNLRPHRLSPVVQRIVAEHDLDLTAVVGTGRDGRIRKRDVLAVLATREADSAEEPPLHSESPYRPQTISTPPGADSAVAAPGRLSHMRRQIGEHMKRSLQTAATCTSWIEADMTSVERIRHSRGLTALPYVARATIEALLTFPALNATLDGETYRRHGEVHLGIAVSLGEDGLIVPVIRDAHELSVEGLARRTRELAARARAGELSPDEVQGATFTITNPGASGTLMATPIINQPQVAILDLEAIVKRAVVLTDGGDGDAIAIRSMTVLGLSWDHRALDGVQAARFLAAVRDGLERVPAA